MATSAAQRKEFKVGTVGWTADDLDDPAVRALWDAGRYEIIDGALVETMAAAYFAHGNVPTNLMFIVRDHLEARRMAGRWSWDVDLVLSPDRVARADLVWMSAGDRDRDGAEARRRGRPDPRKSPVYVPPTLVIESVSPDHAAHDRRTERRWYAEFGVPNYWALDAYDRSLACLALEGGAYRETASGREAETIHPPAFPGLAVPLRQVWDE